MLLALSQAMDIVRKVFTMNEQKLIIDAFNGVILTPQLLGQHIQSNVEETITLYQYDMKWGVNKDDILNKISKLDMLERALVELWAVSFWAINENLENYLKGETTLQKHVYDIANNLLQTAKKLENSETIFKNTKTVEDIKDISRKVSNLLA